MLIYCECIAQRNSSDLNALKIGVLQKLLFLENSVQTFPAKAQGIS